MMSELASVNPATGQTIRTYAEASPAAVDTAMRAAGEAFHGWRRTSFNERAALVQKVAGLLSERQEDLARLMALEMGKPLAHGRAEIQKCAWVCRFFAGNAAGFLAPEPVKTDAAESFVTFSPLGVLLAIMPWNFPFWQVFRAAAPSVMAGNCMVLKHAANVPGCALAIADLFRDAGFPDGVFTNLLIGSKRAAELIDHPVVKAVTLTGSVAAGRAVAARAGKALKKTVLELGGSDPYLVLADADISAAAEICVKSRLINSGQSCIAAKRFIVVETIAEEFERLFVKKMEAQKMGDPLDESVTVGPLARVDLRDELHDLVQSSIQQGARLLIGGNVPGGPGAFYPPTVLSGVMPGMQVFEEETFGPVAALIRAADEDEAIRLANATRFGLGAAVFTRDIDRGRRIAAEQLEAGACVVNGLVASDPRLPFGGVKESGYGRELGIFGIREFVNIKSVVVQ